MALRLLNYYNRSMCRIPCFPINARSVTYGVPKDEKIKSQKFEGYYVLFEHKQKELASFFNRYKYYQSIVAPTYLVAHIALMEYYQIDSAVTPFLPVVLVCHAAAVFLATTYFNNMIVIVYQSKDEKDIIFSYITFWGKRKDIHVKSSDIKVLPKSGGKTGVSYILIPSLNQKLIMPVKNTRMYDDKAFSSLFGCDVLAKYTA